MASDHCPTLIEAFGAAWAGREILGINFQEREHFGRIRRDHRGGVGPVIGQLDDDR